MLNMEGFARTLGCDESDLAFGNCYIFRLDLNEVDGRQQNPNDCDHETAREELKSTEIGDGRRLMRPCLKGLPVFGVRFCGEKSNANQIRENGGDQKVIVKPPDFGREMERCRNGADRKRKKCDAGQADTAQNFGPVVLVVEPPLETVMQRNVECVVDQAVELV